MVSFKLAAIKILEDAKEPLHYEEITKRALEKNLIETSGKTPEETMNSQISTDIKHRSDKTPFLRAKPGYFGLKPDYKVSKQEEQEKAEEEVEEEKEEISTQYTGKAGEHRVVSELLFRGYNASIMNVDEGLDIVATKDGKLFNIQVKTSNENKFGMHISDIRISSFEKHNTNNTYYIFVLRGKETKFLVLPYHEIQKDIDQENILVINKNTRYRANIRVKDGKVYLGNKANEVSYYMNNWDLIK